ncbi:cytochrome d ubiquinol oxidase subunit II, partial [bacterium]|nr:cytochrome d ubiquinol oxidase subunit II [bacterium]
MIDLNTTWYLLFGVLIGGYAILDGFDLGVGVLHLFTSDETEKRINLNAIGPVWDGNEVWLLTAGGALFAAFPPVYATVFSGFYIALMLLLAALIFRAVSLEFRSKLESSSWRKIWDAAFGIGSLLPAVLFGVVVGNILRGVPLNADGLFTGSFLGLLNPYAIVIGVLSLIMFTLHGALYMAIKSDGNQQARMVRTSSILWVVLVVLYFLATVFTFFEAAYLFDGVLGNPLSWLFFILLLGAMVYMPVAIKSKQYFRAFLASSMSILCLIGLPAVGMFPRLVPSLTDLSYSLTIYNASSTQLTLKTMFIITLIGMPIVIGYSWYIYRI